MSKVSISLTTKKERDRKQDKRISLRLSDVSDYAIIKFQSKKIQELFVDLFGSIHMPKSIYSDVTIIKYDKNKIKLNVQYSYYTGRDKPRMPYDSRKVMFFENSFMINENQVKFISSKGGEEKTLKAFYKDFYKAEYDYYKGRIADIEELLCDYPTYMTDRESFILLIDAYLT
jgi:NAD+--asparagine ADP-ribosyltransferase